MFSATAATLPHDMWAPRGQTAAADSSRTLNKRGRRLSNTLSLLTPTPLYKLGAQRKGSLLQYAIAAPLPAVDECTARPPSTSPQSIVPAARKISTVDTATPAAAAAAHSALPPTSVKVCVARPSYLPIFTGLIVSQSGC